MSRSNSHEGLSLNLRSSEPSGSVNYMAAQNRNDGMSVEMTTFGAPLSKESRMPSDDHSHQVIPEISHPEILHAAAASEKLTEPPDSTSYPNSRLPNSQFAPGTSRDQIPDDVMIEKQRAREEFYSRGDPSFPTMESSGAASQHQDYHSSVMVSQGLERMDTQPPSYAHLPSSDSQLLSDVGGPGMSGPGAPVSWEIDPDLQITEKEYPAWAKEGQFDCVLIYSEKGDDVTMAINFKDLLAKFVKLEGGEPPKVCILDRSDNLTYIQSRFKHSDEAMERSTYMFLFITENFVDDAWAEMQKDECLMGSLRVPDKKWCVVPLHTKKKSEQTFQYPYGLRALKGVDISIVVPGKNLANIDVETLKENEIDHYFLKNITRMFNQRIGHKLEREKRHKDKVKKWVREEKEKRYEAKLKRIQAEKMERLVAEQRQVALQRAFVQQEAEVRERLARMPVPSLDSSVELPTQQPFYTSGQPQAPQSSEPANLLQRLLGVGVPLEEALRMAEMQKTSNAAPTGPVAANNYVIYNTGQMQIGDKPNQNVNPTPAAMTTNTERQASQLDSGLDCEYSLVEASEPMTEPATEPAQSQSQIRTDAGIGSRAGAESLQRLVPGMNPSTTSYRENSSFPTSPEESSTRSQNVQYTSWRTLEGPTNAQLMEQQTLQKAALPATNSGVTESSPVSDFDLDSQTGVKVRHGQDYSIEVESMIQK